MIIINRLIIRKILFISIIFLATFSCRKINSHYIEGTVKEAYTGNPIENASVVLQYWNYAGRGNYIYDSVYTNSEGKFNFNHRKHRGWSYRMWVIDKDYYCWDSYDLTHINPRPPYNFELIPPAFVKLNIKKLTSAPNKISVGEPYFSFSTLSAGGLQASPFDTTVLRKMPSGRMVRIDWGVNSYTNGLSASPTSNKSYYYDFSVNKNDTLKYAIEYD